VPAILPINVNDPRLTVAPRGKNFTICNVRSGSSERASGRSFSLNALSGIVTFTLA
jgi:hypothetical protein